MVGHIPVLQQDGVGADRRHNCGVRMRLVSVAALDSFVSERAGGFVSFSLP